MAGDAYTDLNYHLVFSTKKRYPFLNQQKIKKIRQLLKKKNAELGTRIHILNGVEDHIHILCSIPPRLSLASVLNHFKGYASHEITELFWQAGYSAFTVDKSSFKKIFLYIKNQEAHHRSQNFSDELKALIEHTRP